MLHKIALISFILCCFACKNGKIRKLYYPSGEIKEIDTMLNDSTIIGTSYGFFRNGKIDAMEVYDSFGKLNGTVQYFWDNGSFLDSVKYVNGLAQGECIAYDSIGNLYYKKFYFDDKEVGDYCIYKNNKVSIYKFFDFNERLIKQIEYDKNGNIVSSKGTLIFLDSLQFKPKQNGFYSYKISMLQSNPLHSANKLIATYYDDYGKLMDKDSLITTGKHLVKLEKKAKSHIANITLKDVQYDSISKKTLKWDNKYSFQTLPN